MPPEPPKEREVTSGLTSAVAYRMRRTRGLGQGGGFTRTDTLDRVAARTVDVPRRYAGCSTIRRTPDERH